MTFDDLDDLLLQCKKTGDLIIRGGLTSEHCKCVVQEIERGYWQPLTTIDLRSCREMPKDTALILANVAFQGKLKELRHLDLSKCERIANAGFLNLAEAAKKGLLPNLVSLRLSGCVRIEDSSVTAFADAALQGHLPKLEIVEFNACRRISSNGPIAFVRAAAQGTILRLAKFEFAWCPEVGDEVLVEFPTAAESGYVSNLTEVNLRGCNKITDVGLAHLVRAHEAHLLPLRWLGIDETNIKSVDRQTLEQGDFTAICEAFRRGRALRRVKVCVVGMGEVGKTSLMRPLFMDRPIKSKKEWPDRRTPDIDFLLDGDISWYPDPVFIRKDGPTIFKPIVWDFGGQWALQALHEYHLRYDPRTLYLLVLDSTRALQGGPTSETDGNQFDHWITMLSNYAGPDAPLVVAVSKDGMIREGMYTTDDGLDTRPFNDPPEPEAFPNRRLLDWSMQELTDRSPRVPDNEGVDQAGVKFVELVDRCDAQRHVPALRDAIRQAMCGMEYLWTARTLEVVEPVLKSVESAWKSGLGVMSTEEFRIICQEEIENLNLRDAEKEDNEQKRDLDDGYLETLLHQARSIGALFYYGWLRSDVNLTGDRLVEPIALGELARGQHHDPRSTELQRTLFNPKWLKGPLYEMTRKSQEAAIDGRLVDESELEDWLEGAIQIAESLRKEKILFAPVENAAELIRLVLVHTGVCVPVKQVGSFANQYLFPRTLPKATHGRPVDWGRAESECEGISHARWKWRILPEHAFHRFMAVQLTRGRVQWLDGRLCVGRYGMVLAWEDMEIVVAFRPDVSTIYAWCRGNVAGRDPFNMLLSELTVLNCEEPIESSVSTLGSVAKNTSQNGNEHPPRDARHEFAVQLSAVVRVLCEHHKYDRNQSNPRCLNLVRFGGVSPKGKWAVNEPLQEQVNALLDKSSKIRRSGWFSECLWPTIGLSQNDRLKFHEWTDLLQQSRSRGTEKTKASDYNKLCGNEDRAGQLDRWLRKLSEYLEYLEEPKRLPGIADGNPSIELAPDDSTQSEYEVDDHSRDSDDRSGKDVS